MPGENREQDVEYLGVMWPAHPLPEYMGCLFTACCRFWAIMQEVSRVYFARVDTPFLSRVSLAFAESKYQKLLHWTDLFEDQIFDWDQMPARVVLFQ